MADESAGAILDHCQHLFDFEVPGEVAFRESDFLTAGEEPTIVDTGTYNHRFKDAITIYFVSSSRIQYISNNCYGRLVQMLGVLG